MESADLRRGATVPPGRFKALYVLTGGTPRTRALLHTVLALEHSDRIERDLESLLDQLTPYYKARFDDLPPQSQVIVDKVALHWYPITAAACQAATHLDVNTVSAQLSRLVKSGLLTKVSLPEANKLGFQISERFFNIWYLMRASRRLRRRLSWFVEFLRIFYGEVDLRRRAEELVRAEPKGSLDSPARFLSFASAVPDEALRRQLEFRAIEQQIAPSMGELNQKTLKILLPRTMRGYSDYALELGNPLLDAISSGEVPSLAEVSTAGEVRQIIEIVKIDLD